MTWISEKISAKYHLILSYDIAYIPESYTSLIGLNDRAYIHGEVVYTKKEKKRKKEKKECHNRILMDHTVFSVFIWN